MEGLASRQRPPLAVPPAGVQFRRTLPQEPGTPAVFAACRISFFPPAVLNNFYFTLMASQLFCLLLPSVFRFPWFFKSFPLFRASGSRRPFLMTDSSLKGP